MPVKEWLFRLLFGNSRPSHVCNFEHFDHVRCSVDSFNGSFSSKNTDLQLHTYEHKPEEGSSYILLCADNFMGRQALTLINVQKEKSLPWSEWCFFFLLQGGTSIIFMTELDEGQSKQSKAILNTSSVKKINLNKAPTIFHPPTGAIRAPVAHPPATVSMITEPVVVADRCSRQHVTHRSNQQVRAEEFYFFPLSQNSAKPTCTSYSDNPGEQSGGDHTGKVFLKGW